MDKASCVIIGCAKNVAGQLPKTLEKIEAIRALWAQAAVVIAENGSTDGTKRLLDDYKAKPNTHILTLDGSANAIPSRTQRLALIRNTLLDFVHATYPTYDYILMADMDGVLDSLDPKTLAFAFKPSMPAWDALFANVRGP
jgi:glycosyltransferase involved in cell wall biosynthesis